MSVAKFEPVLLHGDALEMLKGLDGESVDCCVTSPPYYGLRDYGVDGQIGLEETPEEYVAKLVDVLREVKRVLRSDGTLWLNIADSYAGSGKGRNSDGSCSATGKQATNTGAVIGELFKDKSGCKPKDLIGIPWLLAFALRADGWYLRQEIIWSKPNPMPESVKDRCTKSHESIFLLSKSPNYYFDGEAISEIVADSTVTRMQQDIESQAGSTRVPGKSNGVMKAVAAPRYGGKKYTENQEVFNRTKSGNAYDFRERRNKRDVWTISTTPFSGAHFATFPKALVEPCVLAGSRVGGTVLDPFNGAGTTGVVAMNHGRNYVGIDLNAEYLDITRRRFAEEVQYAEPLF